MSRQKDSTEVRDAKNAVMLKAYVDLVKKTKRLPIANALTRAGVYPQLVHLHFGNMRGIEKAARDAHPEAFKGMVDEVLFSPGRLRAVSASIAKHKRFVITTAVSGCLTHAGFAAAIKTYCKKHDALLLILVATDPASHSEKDGLQLDEHLKDATIIVEDTTINRNLFLSAIKLSAKQIDPTTGLARFGQRSGSFIYASPKQSLALGATGVTGLPHAMMTTGAITRPDYEPDDEGGIKYMSKRTAYIAEFDHVIGAIVVEVDGPNLFHFRQIQAEESGAFIDLGVRYDSKGTSEAACEAVILGDWHSGETDPVAADAFVFGKGSLVNRLKPTRLVLHDTFNGTSCNPHEADNLVARAINARQGLLSLEKEVAGCATDLNRLSNYADELVIVASNHDNFLMRYLQSGRFIGDAENIPLACTLLTDYTVKGTDPLQNAIKLSGLVKMPSKLNWLTCDDSCQIAGIECGSHGDRGANGSKGSLKGVENALGPCVVGHAHTPAILRQVFRVGTTSKLKLSYNKGPSSWLHTACALYSTGARQLINVIDGRWHA